MRSRMSEKRDQKTDVVLYSSLVVFWVGVGKHFGSQNRSKVDQELDQIPESVLERVFEIKARGRCQNVTFA